MELMLVVLREPQMDAPKVDLRVILRAGSKALLSGFRLVAQPVDLTGRQKVVERVANLVVDWVESLAD
jgi:hypothetical protein